MILFIYVLLLVMLLYHNSFFYFVMYSLKYLEETAFHQPEYYRIPLYYVFPKILEQTMST